MCMLFYILLFLSRIVALNVTSVSCQEYSGTSPGACSLCVAEPSCLWCETEHKCVDKTEFPAQDCKPDCCNCVKGHGVCPKWQWNSTSWLTAKNLSFDPLCQCHFLWTDSTCSDASSDFIIIIGASAVLILVVLLIWYFRFYKRRITDKFMDQAGHEIGTSVSPLFVFALVFLC